MNKVTSEQVKELREKHNIGIMEAKRMAEMHNLKEAIVNMNVNWGQEIKDILLKITELIK